MLHFLGFKEQSSPSEQYCRACRALGEDDCAHCDPATIHELMNDG
ncbi:hypothetical protein [Desulfobulbus elongatus]|nr:hypothetical protein [Desulfobulbus elongatus]